MLVGQRRRLLDYLQRNDLEGYRVARSRSWACAAERTTSGLPPCVALATIVAFGFRKRRDGAHRPKGAAQKVGRHMSMTP